MFIYFVKYIQREKGLLPFGVFVGKENQETKKMTLKLLSTHLSLTAGSHYQCCPRSISSYGPTFTNMV